MAFDLRVLGQFPEPEFAQLARDAFSDFAMPSPQLAEVLSAESAGRDSSLKLAEPPSLRIGAPSLQQSLYSLR